MRIILSNPDVKYKLTRIGVFDMFWYLYNHLCLISYFVDGVLIHGKIPAFHSRVGL